MDKDKLFYIVKKGTNDRHLIWLPDKLRHRLYILDETGLKIRKDHNWDDEEYLSITQYEDKFGIEPTDEPTLMEMVIPTIYTVAESLDYITIRQTGVNCYIFNEEKYLAVLSGVHGNLSLERDYSKGIVNLTKNGRIYATVTIDERINVN